MEIQFSIDTAANLIRMKVWGQVTTDEFIRNARILYNDPRFKKGMNTLADVSEAEFNPSFREVLMTKNFVKALEEARGFCKWAIFDAGKSEVREFLKLYSTVSDDLRIETRLFDDTAEAEEWVLG